MYPRVYVEITNICNLNCSFCHGHHRTPACMSREQFAHILTQLQGKTQYIYYHLMGEPLFHPRLPEFLEMARESGFRSVITTNGTLLAERGRPLLAAGVHKVSVSLHSFERGDEADCHRYLEQICAFAEEAEKAGTILSLRLWNRGADGGRNAGVEAFLRSRLPGDWAENTRGYRIRDKVFLEWGDRFVWPDMENPEQSGEVVCYGMQDHFGILCDGTVVPCCLDSEGCIALGNVFKEALAQILSSPRAKAIGEGLRHRTAAEDLCRRCPYASKKR